MFDFVLKQTTEGKYKPADPICCKTHQYTFPWKFVEEEQCWCATDFFWSVYDNIYSSAGWNVISL